MNTSGLNQHKMACSFRHIISVMHLSVKRTQNRDFDHWCLIWQYVPNWILHLCGIPRFDQR